MCPTWLLSVLHTALPQAHSLHLPTHTPCPSPPRKQLCSCQLYATSQARWDLSQKQVLSAVGLPGCVTSQAASWFAGIGPFQGGEMEAVVLFRRGLPAQPGHPPNRGPALRKSPQILPIADRAPTIPHGPEPVLYSNRRQLFGN